MSTFDIKSLFTISEKDLATVVLDKYADQLPGIIQMGEPYFAIDLAKHQDKTYEELCAYIRDNFMIEAAFEELSYGANSIYPEKEQSAAIVFPAKTYLEAVRETETPPGMTIWLVAALLSDSTFDYVKMGTRRPKYEFALTFVHTQEDRVVTFYGVN